MNRLAELLTLVLCLVTGEAREVCVTREETHMRREE